MAIYHCSIKIISRGKGKSAVAAAAYRSGETMTNDYDGITHDYTRKGGVVHTEILLPENAPRGFFDRSTLWNSVEKIEKNKNAQLAREIEIALPRELNSEVQLSLVRKYCKDNFVSKGMCADVCIHDKKDGNPHAHIMLTMRPILENGEWGAKSKKEYVLDENGERIRLKNGNFKTAKICTVDWNERTKAEEWRKAWADICNEYLSQQSIDERVDHRSYARQGIELVPGVHMGAAIIQMERKGIRTEKGEKNHEIAEINKRLRQIKARIYKLENWLKEACIDASPTLQEVFDKLTNHPEHRSQNKQISDLKLTAKTLIFIQEHKIKTLTDMTQAVRNLRAQYDEIHKKILHLSRRYHTLVEHINQADNYKKYIKTYNRYNELKGDRQDVYFKKHSDEISAFTEAHKYMVRHLNGYKEIPYGEWKKELDNLTLNRDSMMYESRRLADELRSAEAIRRNAEKVMGVQVGGLHDMEI